MSGILQTSPKVSQSCCTNYTGCVLSSGGDIQNIEKLQWHSSKSQTCKENQPILNSDLNKQYMFSKNTASSEPSQNYFTK